MSAQQKVFDFRVLPRIKECLGSWTPPGTIFPHQRYLEIYRMHDRVVPIPIERQIEEMHAAGVYRAVICAADNEFLYGKKTPNEIIANLQNRHPETFIGFAGVEPYKGMGAVRELDYAIRELGLKGVNMGPWIHKMLANDKRYYPIYTKAAELGIPVVLHTSSHFDPTTTMETGNPVYLDEVAIHFPELKLIASHAGWPWILQMVAVAWRHPNVYLELSGISPRYLHPELVRYFDTPILQDKVLFGTDYPLYSFQRGVQEFLELPLKEETREKILWKNANRLFGLDD